MNGEAVVLGFDTSCYTTSVAAVDLAGRPVASCRRLLPVPSGERGLRQSEAVFIHVRQLPVLMEELGSAHPRLHYCSGVRFDTTPG